MGLRMVDYGHVEMGRRYIVLRPNSSLSTRQAMFFLAGISVVSISIAMVFFFMGLWVVLPFSGMELLALGCCLWLTMKKCNVQEVITITDKAASVQRGLNEMEEEEELPMGWVQVELNKPLHRGYPTSLTIGSHGKRIEVGRFLVESERKKLAKQLIKMLQVSTL